MFNYAGAQKRPQMGQIPFWSSILTIHEPVFSLHIYRQKHANEDISRENAGE
jgi:hypothetical protein